MRPWATAWIFKMGVWDTIIGYEVTDSINNPNFTRSYGYTIEPPTHTGIRAAYLFSETLSAICWGGGYLWPEDQPARVPAPRLSLTRPTWDH